MILPSAFVTKPVLCPTNHITYTLVITFLTNWVCVRLKGRTLTFVGASRVLPALAAALPERPDATTLSEVEVIVWELMAQLVTMASAVGLELGRGSSLRSVVLSESGEESSSEEEGETTQEDADQLVQDENYDGES